MQPGETLDLARLAGDLRLEVLVTAIGDDEERFLDTLTALDDLLAEAPAAEVAILEPSRASEEVAGRGALLAEVAYRHAAPVPIPVIHELVPSCGNRCRGCTLTDLRARRPGGDVGAVVRELTTLAATGERRVFFGVRELALRPDFCDLLGRARDLGFTAIHVATSGRPFARGGLAARAVAAGATHFHVSLHAGDGPTHDHLTGVAGSFAETVAGIGALQGAGAEVLATTVVCRPNVDRLDAVIDRLRELDVRHALLSQLAILGRARAHLDELLVPLAEMAPRAVAAATRAETLGVRVGIAGVPYCLADGAERFLGVDDLTSLYDADPREAVEVAVPFVRARACLRCAAYAICRGVPEEYLKRHGKGELRPQSGPRATRRVPAALAGFFAMPPRAAAEAGGP